MTGPHLGAGSIDAYELKHLLDWCELGYTNESFWQRWVLASTIYNERTRLAMLELHRLTQDT